jgi:hypothetical protein
LQGRKSGPTYRFGIPLDLVGGPDRPWPGAPALDAGLRDLILDLELSMRWPLDYED